MTRGHLRRIGPMGTAALVLLAVHGFGLVNSAWAGCRHPSGSQSDPFRDLYRLDALLFSAGSFSHSRDSLSELPAETPARPSPCSGMSCSSRDSLPVSTGSPTFDSPHQWVVALFALIDLDPNSRALRMVHEPVRITAGEKTAIFHPPRV